MDIFDKCKALLERIDKADEQAKRKKKKAKSSWIKGGKKV